MNTRPYLIINNKRSDEVKGLLISSLAPISKPAMRIKTETVAGRDGDIVTELGYSAYDKTVDIGLTYEYCIDDVISFFNQSGHVVFSNEPDKYYLFNIYKQIDFERLIRFKQASVTFHVQPFKYADREASREFALSASSQEFVIRNNGNYFSRPTLTITGRGAVTMYINNEQVLIINFPTLGATYTIDGAAMNAYDSNGDFVNRQVIGNYDNITLRSGENKIKFTGGYVSKVDIVNYSRWI